MRAFEIAGPEKAVHVTRDGAGSAQFVITNLTSSVIQIRVQVFPHDPADSTSFRIEGAAVQNIGAKEKKNVSVSIQLAKPEAAAPHTFTLEALDLDSVEGGAQTSQVEVLASAHQKGAPFKLSVWVLVPLLMLLGALIGIAIGYAYHRRHLSSPQVLTMHGSLFSLSSPGRGHGQGSPIKGTTLRCGLASLTAVMRDDGLRTLRAAAGLD